MILKILKSKNRKFRLFHQTNRFFQVQFLLAKIDFYDEKVEIFDFVFRFPFFSKKMFSFSIRIFFCARNCLYSVLQGSVLRVVWENFSPAATHFEQKSTQLARFKVFRSYKNVFFWLSIRCTRDLWFAEIGKMMIFLTNESFVRKIIILSISCTTSMVDIYLRERSNTPKKPRNRVFASSRYGLNKISSENINFSQSYSFWKIRDLVYSKQGFSIIKKKHSYIQGQRKNHNFSKRNLIK